MSGQSPHQIPPHPEQPSGESAQDAELESRTIEDYSLSDLASKSTLRAVVATQQDRESLNERIGVLQQKLNHVEQRNEQLVDQSHADRYRMESQAVQLAELRQAKRTSQLLFRDGTISLALGSVLVSLAGLFATSIVKWIICGIGGGMIVVALWICKMIQRNIWPAERPELQTQIENTPATAKDIT